MVFTWAVFFRVAGPLARPEAWENDMIATSLGSFESSRADCATRAPWKAPPSGCTIVRLRAALDIKAAPELRERLIGVLRRGAGLLVLDLSQVPSCDVAGLAVLIGTQRRGRQLGVEVRLAAPSPAVAKVLRSTGLDHSFTICQDASEGPLASEDAASDDALASELDELAGPSGAAPRMHSETSNGVLEKM
jgi:anti-sigma B factor antagonist